MIVAACIVGYVANILVAARIGFRYSILSGEYPTDAALANADREWSKRALEGRRGECMKNVWGSAILWPLALGLLLLYGICYAANRLVTARPPVPKADREAALAARIDDLEDQLGMKRK
jgi:hypothetical protein